MRLYLFFLLVGSLFDSTPTSAQLRDGLYFELRGTTYLPGSTVLLEDIGTAPSSGDPDMPGGTLVCHTNNVNTQCCRTSDGGNVGEWFFPNGSMVPRNNNHGGFVFTRSGSAQQVRLNQRFQSDLEPVGEYECRVPDSNGVEHTATITIALNIDECVRASNCAADATCTNTPGSFTCTCNLGYTGDGTVCTGEFLHTIPPVTTSLPTTESTSIPPPTTETLYTTPPATNEASSTSQYLLTTSPSTDIDECAIGMSNCAADATCTDTTGSFTCTCNPGYARDGTVCTAAGQSTGVLVGAVAGASISTAFIILIILMIVVIAMRRNRQASLELKLEASSGGTTLTNALAQSGSYDEIQDLPAAQQPLPPSQAATRQPLFTPQATVRQPLPPPVAVRPPLPHPKSMARQSLPPPLPAAKQPLPPLKPSAKKALSLPAGVASGGFILKSNPAYIPTTFSAQSSEGCSNLGAEEDDYI